MALAHDDATPAPRGPATNEAAATGTAGGGAAASGSATAPRRPAAPARAGLLHPGRWRLRTRLIAILLAFLGIACLVIGAASYAAMDANLTGQLRTRLAEASDRATSFAGPHRGQDGTGADGSAGGADGGQDAATSTPSPSSTAPNPLNAPGQAAGTLNARVVGGEFVFGGMLDTRGSAVALTAADEQTLLNLPVGKEAQRVSLSQGDYLALAEKDASGQTVITGLPTADVDRTLTTLLLITVGVSAAALVLAGLLGSWAIRRTMKPLERVSAVATDVSQLDLGAGQLPPETRVAPADARPSTEVGAVGHALNLMLENVDSALSARQRSEDRVREFVADASHELRTPLAAIRGYSDLLKWTEDLTEDGQRSLGRIDSQSQRMAALVEDLLLLARLDQGHQPVSEDVDLTELVVESVSDLQVAAPSHRWALELPEEPVVVRGDPRQLRQVLMNLLSNARKHTDDGTTVTTALGVSANRREAVLTVTDDGPGIDPDFLPRIFSRFARADQARSGEVGTTGLGLAIVKAIVESHGGRIAVASRPGRTEFEVRLPTATAS
ncbi:integral membrane sensor signal transduction histidine kinase [Mycobacteroides abscessus subsp. abscessus]|nr:integral membrane sensor signal transduction histidine kinase [Mycobacteroides abscessus subsp. abscessus]